VNVEKLIQNVISKLSYWTGGAENAAYHVKFIQQI